MREEAYTRTEVEEFATGDEWPERGPLCHKCGMRIPQFAELGEADEQRIHQFAREQGPGRAIPELQSATGCSVTWAKIWAVHVSSCLYPVGEKPCPYCGEPLRTPLAKQCRYCGKDWHDSENVVMLGVG